MKPMNACVHTYKKSQTSSTRRRVPGWRIHGSVEDTKSSTNKQHTLSTRNEEDQRKFELMCRRQKQAAILHESYRHRNPTSLVKDLKAAGIPIKHLQRYLHAHKCKYCDANLGRASYYCKSAKQPGGEALVLSTVVDPLSPTTPITQTLANEHEVTSAPPTNTMLRTFKTVLSQGLLVKELAHKMADLEATVKQ